jgi:Bacterial TSP3 repeat
MKISRSRLTLTAVLVWSSLAGAARAKEQFPREIADHLGAKTAPPCGVCHEYAKTGGDTLVTPFAWGMRARGLTGQGTLLAALDRVRADGVDSDGDGATDVDELIAGTDPNSAASTPARPGLVEDPKLGCAVAGPGGAGERRWTWIIAAVGLVWLRRARRS